MWQRIDSWRVLLANGARGDVISRLLASIDAERLGDVESVRRTRSRHVFRTALDDGTRAYVKHHSPRGWRDALRAFVLGSGPRQEFRNLARIQALELPVVEALCCAESRRTRSAVLVTRAAELSATLRERAPGLDEAALLELARQLGSVIRRMHDRGLWHRDLHVGNVLAAGPPERCRPLLVDVQKMRRLRVPVPMFLRVTDLVRLHRGLNSAGCPAAAAELASAYASSGKRPLDLDALRARLQRAAPRRARQRLRSRGRRCVTRSSGFRQERAEGGRFIYRRADIASAQVLAAVDAHLRRGGACSRIDDIAGGPAAEPPPRIAQRGWGAVEPSARAPSPVVVRQMRGREGMRAWRGAHAALLRGIETPAPLALVEERSLGRVTRAWLVTRWDARLERLDGSEVQAGALEAFVARAHAAGVTLASLDLGRLRFVRDHAVVVLDPGALRFSRSASATQREADTTRIGAWLTTYDDATPESNSR